jgi:hypothetical protein
MKHRPSTSWFAGSLLAAVVGMTLGCVAQPAGNGDEPPAIEQTSEAALGIPGGITPNACQPNGADISVGGHICNAHSVGPRGPSPLCCSGFAQFICPVRGEPGELDCVP